MHIHSIVIFVDLRSEGLVLVLNSLRLFQRFLDGCGWMLSRLLYFLNSLLGVHVWLLLGFFVLALASWGFD